ncbi:MAG: ABC transporter permease [Gammaproteobacteria bacterium]|jgi:capsular polysaccharide transport system permease protein|nr:ABC transporter permease [Gammaproteobacteria bacterium]
MPDPIDIQRILALPDKEFLPEVFRALLGRDPDPDGLHYYTNRLQQGISRTLVLLEFRTSAEAKKRAGVLSVPELDALVPRYRFLKQLPLGKWRWLFLPRLEKTVKPSEQIQSRQHQEELSFREGLAIQRRVIWALIMRETVTRYGRENLGMLWFFAEPLMFIVGITLLWSYVEPRSIPSGTVAAFAVVSYPTVLLWRNATGRVTNAIEANRALLHHRPIRPQDFFYSRILLEFASATGAFLVIFILFVAVGISHFPASLFDMVMGWLMVAWFAFGFILTMGGLSEVSEVVEKVSHIILYLMLPFSGAFFPAYIVPEPIRNYLLLFPLADCVEFFRHGYYGNSFPSYYHLGYTIVCNLALTLFGLAMMTYAFRKVEAT